MGDNTSIIQDEGEKKFAVGMLADFKQMFFESYRGKNLIECYDLLLVLCEFLSNETLYNEIVKYVEHDEIQIYGSVNIFQYISSYSQKTTYVIDSHGVSVPIQNTKLNQKLSEFRRKLLVYFISLMKFASSRGLETNSMLVKDNTVREVFKELAKLNVEG